MSGWCAPPRSANSSKDYVTAARVAGVGPLRLMFSTVLPNCLAPLIVQAALGVSDAILEAAGLGFLGLGAQPPTPEWGSMLADSREFIRSDPWIVALPGLAILDHRRRDQPDRRRAARRARSQDAAELGDGRCSKSAISRVSFATRHGAFMAVDGVDVTVDRDEVLAIVGESGSGKSVAMLAVMGLLPFTARVERRPHGVRRRTTS